MRKCYMLSGEDWCREHHRTLDKCMDLALIEEIHAAACKPCPSCSSLRARAEKAEAGFAGEQAKVKTLEDFQCRTDEAFRNIKDKIYYSHFAQLETAIYGSFSCAHAEKLAESEARIAELEKENKRLREAVKWACDVEEDEYWGEDDPCYGEFLIYDKFVEELRRRSGID